MLLVLSFEATPRYSLLLSFHIKSAENIILSPSHLKPIKGWTSNPRLFPKQLKSPLWKISAADHPRTLLGCQTILGCVWLGRLLFGAHKSSFSFFLHPITTLNLHAIAMLKGILTICLILGLIPRLEEDNSSIVTLSLQIWGSALWDYD